MAIDRAGPIPPFWQYVAETILVPQNTPAAQNLLNLQTANLRWIYIPTFQRGISWTVDNVSEFLTSDSVLLGNVILAQFPTPGPLPNYLLNLPVGQGQYHVLVDGLQRLAVGTALLALLHDPFLSPNPTRPNDSPLFAGLTSLVQSRAAAYLHNDHEFQNHPRRAVQDQYKGLRQALAEWISQRIGGTELAQFAADVVTTMTAKQVAIDVYFNFPGTLALMNTFLGLNTVRVDLGPVDLLRSFLVEKAQSDGWAPPDIEAMENDFTEIFVRDEKPDSELLPFVNVVLDFVRRNYAATIFPSWATRLDRNEVDTFLDFVGRFKSCTGSPYYDEIRACGSLPLAILMSFYYRSLLSGLPSPSFLQRGVAEDAELHHFLLACYRVLLDGRVGRTGQYAPLCINGTFNSLADLGEQISSDFLALSLQSAVDRGWLGSCLARADRNRSKRIFNAMLLPPKINGFGGSFQPLPFGRRSDQYHIDHLIAETLLRQNQPGYPEAEGIRNFAPLPSNQNRVAKATSCSAKLGPNGIYDAYVNTAQPQPHPYALWLLQHARHLPAAQLDDQRFLEPNSQPPIGAERLDKLIDDLLGRL